MIDFQLALTRWQASLTEQSLSPRTVSDYGYYVRAIHRDVTPLLGPSATVRTALNNWRAQQTPLIKRKLTSSSRVRSYIAALRSFFAYCVKTHLVEADPTDDLVAPSSPETLPRPLSHSDVDAVFTQLAGPAPEQVQDVAIAWLCYLSVRNSEACGLTTSHITLDESAGMFALQFPAKGDKERLVLLNVPASEALATHLLTTVFPAGLAAVDVVVAAAPPGEDLLAVRRAARLELADLALREYELSGAPARPVFTMNGRQLTRRDISRRWVALRAEGKLSDKVQPHALRHTFATELLENGEDIRAVQELLGHSSIKTTAIYTKVTRGRKATAIAKLRTPQLATPMEPLELVATEA